MTSQTPEETHNTREGKEGITLDLGNGTKATLYEGLRLEKRHLDIIQQELQNHGEEQREAIRKAYWAGINEGGEDYAGEAFNPDDFFPPSQISNNNMETPNTRGIEEIDELVKEFKNQFGAWQTTSNQPYPMFVEWFEREIKKIYQTHHQELQKVRVETNQKWLSAIDEEIYDMNAQGSVFEEMTDRMRSKLKP